MQVVCIRKHYYNLQGLRTRVQKRTFERQKNMFNAKWKLCAFVNTTIRTQIAYIRAQ